MSIKAGDLITVGNTILVDRLQTSGPGNLNIPREKIYELGNYESIGSVLDTPDLQFSMESFDVSAQLEALLVGEDFGSATPGTTHYDIANARPIDVVSQFKAGRTAPAPFNIVGTVAVPFLMLDSLSYRFGVRDNASQTANLRGDGIYMAAGSSYVEQVVGSGDPDQEHTLDHEPIPYNGDNVAGTRYVLSATIMETGERLNVGLDYSEDLDVEDDELTVTFNRTIPASQTVQLVYQSAVTATYPQGSHAPPSATRPAAVRGRDIEVRIGGNTITDRWSSIQSVQLDWRVQLERDEELGNAQVVGQDFDVPEVTGTVSLQPFDTQELMTRVRQIAGLDTDEVVGALSTVPLSLDIIIHSPDDGSVIKTLHTPDARFTVPGFQGRVQQKQTLDFPFESDSGVLEAWVGART